MPKHLSPAGEDRVRRLDQAHDADRTGRSQNRNAAQEELPPSHGDPPRSRDLPTPTTAGSPQDPGPDRDRPEGRRGGPPRPPRRPAGTDPAGRRQARVAAALARQATRTGQTRGGTR